VPSPPAVIDTNVVVSALLTRDPEAPTARLLDRMVRGDLRFLLSIDLLTEYREVLLREPLRRLHGLGEEQVDRLLTVIVANAVLREPGPVPSPAPPDAGDRHLWALLGAEPAAVLVTGDRALVDHPPAGRSVLSPAGFLALSRT
jgi:uncharacterized protein